MKHYSYLLVKSLSIMLLVLMMYAGSSLQLFSQTPIALQQSQIAEIIHSFDKTNSSVPGGGDLEKTLAINERFLTGAAAGDAFGSWVANAGDVNGDGYSDIIVGGYGNDAGGTGAGRAYIYFGRTIMSTIPDVILTGAAAGDFFGFSVSSAGDVNGDGYSDVIVGAFLNDAGGENAGRAYVYFGGEVMDTIPDVTCTGATAGEFFGRSVAHAGDVNADGYSDVIVGAPYYGPGETGLGRAYIYYGGVAMNPTADVVMTGLAAGDLLGTCVSGAGDVNGDGYSDVIIGAYQNDAGGAEAGAAYIYFGGTAMDGNADKTFLGEAVGDHFGWSVSSAGDVNGDGYGDVAIGAYTNGAGGSTAGRAYIYLGSASMGSTPEVIMTGAEAGDRLGYFLSGAGDVNGDGFDDVIIGAPYNDEAGSNAGRAYIYFGNIHMDALPDVMLTGMAAGDTYGYSVSGAGDLNNDGYDDVIVGAPENDAGGSNAGRAYIYFNSLTGVDIADEYFTGEVSGDHFGYSVSGAGDVNGDGYSDIIVGAQGNDAGGTDAGMAYIYFGGVGMDNTPDVTLTGATAGDLCGYSVSSAGDVNGDGYDDVIVGATSNDAVGTNAGAAYIYFGGVNMDTIADIVFRGTASYDFFGSSVSGAGDVDGDGFSDVIVGASNFDGGVFENVGRAYIYFGGIDMDTTADVIITGATAEDYLGSSVSGAGDVNGDGYGDVIVGAWGNDAGGENAGAAFIYYGGSNMNTHADVTLIGLVSNDQFGRSVAGAGDVNGDGYGDVIVGAHYNDAGGDYAGRAYIYFGGVYMNAAADVVITGTLYDELGSSVSGAGDVNNDGYSDVIIGAPVGDGVEIYSGMAYICFGGISMDTIPNVIVKGAEQNDHFGYSVSSAGDINGDGFSDVVIGAEANDAGGSYAGRAYLFQSSSPPIRPRISCVRDVPFDQGGKVNIRWIRSGYDARGVSHVTEYLLQRSNPPGTGGYAWQTISTIPATHEPQYSYDADTPSDSMTNTSGTYFFRVTARTANADEYWRSNIISGHSVDNLSPSAPTGFSLSLLGGSSLQLSWSINKVDPDVWGYHVYRATTSGFPVIPTLRLLSTTDTLAIDSTVVPGTIYYYRVTAVDIHGNKSVPSAEKSSATVGVENDISEEIPREFKLYQNYPNPFNPVTTIEFTVETYDHTSLRVYDLLGREVAVLVDEELPAGVLHRAVFDAFSFSSGIYFYRLQSGNNIQVKKLILMK